MTAGLNPEILTQNIGIMANILETVAVAMGVGLFMMGIFRLKRYAEMRTMMSHQMTLAWPLMMILGGTAMLASPFLIGTLMLNFWSVTSPLHYNPGSASIDELIPPVLMFVRVIGLCALVRGFMMFSRLGREQSPPGTAAKSVLHMVGGLLCLHVLGTVELVKTIFGLAS